jgi:hypothetical protein
MSDRDPRAEELNNLRLALATFALQLDSFEARLRADRQSRAANERNWSRLISRNSQRNIPTESQR